MVIGANPVLDVAWEDGPPASGAVTSFTLEDLEASGDDYLPVGRPRPLRHIESRQATVRPILGTPIAPSSPQLNWDCCPVHRWVGHPGRLRMERRISP